ncbi:FAD-dependent oxidoreductase [Intestinimonas butyriciproducens]|uniref:oxidoreductase n=1 Tax=Intestinimonas butyriciproducens TaxID=1297617 RepID=UPI0018AB2E2A|nr:FAD-dependent oxidoreductase [Intestinimonas butyriciproducens]
MGREKEQVEYKRLFSPIEINGMAVKNRIVEAPIQLAYCKDGHVNERIKQFYIERAKGGVGLIIAGGCRIDDYGYSMDMMSLRADDDIPGWRAFTDAVHGAAPDVKLAVQLYHAGRYAKQKNTGKEAWAPSAVFSNYTRETPRAMTVAEIHEVEEKWAEAAVRAKKAGFDAVEILGSAGYLICQFLSPTTNLREDEYGGSWENRCRFPLAVIRRVREAVGPDFPVTIRITGNAFIPGATDCSDAVRFAKAAEEAGVDAINVTGGWHESIVPQITGDLPRSGFSYLAAAVKAAVHIPVMASNRNNDPDVCEEVLALGRADMICLGRPLLADPEWPSKAAEGRQDEIRRCLGCNQGCLARSFFGRPVECLINARAGREYLYQTPKAPGTRKKILVVGAGPAGCEFALEADKRGHEVTIWEQSGRIGGQLHLACAPISKGEFRTLIDYYEAMLKKRAIRVELSHTAVAEEIRSGGFDEVVIAAGAVPRALPIKSTGKIPVVLSGQVLSREVMPGKNVVVIGGGAVGCEVAQYLADRGSLSAELLKFLMKERAESIETITALLNTSSRSVSIVEMAQKIGNGFDPGCAGPVLRDLKRLGVKKYTSSKVRELTDTEAVLETEGESGPAELRIPCDTVVVCVGSICNRGLYEALAGSMEHVHIIGDAEKIGKVMDAIRQAVDLAEAM